MKRSISAFSLCIPAKGLTQANSLGFVEPKIAVSACIAKAELTRFTTWEPLRISLLCHQIYQQPSESNSCIPKLTKTRAFLFFYYMAEFPK
jgi:hypothetical protein